MKAARPCLARNAGLRRAFPRGAVASVVADLVAAPDQEEASRAPVDSRSLPSAIAIVTAAAQANACSMPGTRAFFAAQGQDRHTGATPAFFVLAVSRHLVYEHARRPAASGAGWNRPRRMQGESATARMPFSSHSSTRMNRALFS